MNILNQRVVLSMDKDWSFHLGDVPTFVGHDHGTVYGLAKAGSCVGVPRADFNAEGWETVTLPHDWSVKLPFDKNGSPSWGYKPKGKAWYRKAFYLPQEYDGKEITVTFDGVAKDCTVYFNGSVIARNYTAYAPFTINITDRALFGNVPNVIAVYVDAEDWEGWWYEGAGIYRHVNLTVKNKLHIAQYGVFVNPTLVEDNEWNCPVEVTAENTDLDYRGACADLHCEISELDTGRVVAHDSKRIVLHGGNKWTQRFNFAVSAPKLWDIDSPNLYLCRTWLDNGIDVEETVFGFRSISFDCDKGFFLNGRSVKLFGTCNHQDHGGVGVAVPDSLHEFRIARLKEMGSNAYRCAHGMPPEELLDCCDRMGMLVMDENRNFETSEEGLSQLRKMVLRDRNHPSVIMYSIFNEETLQGTAQGGKMALRMRSEIHRLDDSRFVTGAMSGGILEADGAGNSLDVCGVNYQMWCYDEFHKKFPKLPMIGSETTSTFSVRGCYKTDRGANLMSCYDQDPADWGDNVRRTWDIILNRDWAGGGFMWTGFDYLGEPTPFVYPSVSSFFGMMDTCGFAKDGYYLCQAIFKKEPVCHVLPHWNFKGREGELIRVMSHTNCEEGELFLNGKSLGRKKIKLTEQAFWEVPYQEGEIKLVGYNGGVKTAECVRETTGEAVEIRIEPWKNKIFGDGIDAIPVNFVAYDSKGREVPDFNGKIKITCEGGEIIGTANGDPNCHEEFVPESPTCAVRSLFCGRAQAIIRCRSGCEGLTLSVDCGMIKCKSVSLEVCHKQGAQAVESVREMIVTGWKMSAKLSEQKPDPMEKIAVSDMNSMEPVDVTKGAPEKFSDAVGKYALYRAKCNIPTVMNGRQPVLHFHQLWGECEIYIGGELVYSNKCWWGTSADIPITERLSGEKEINVIVKSFEGGAGVTASVVIR